MVTDKLPPGQGISHISLWRDLNPTIESALPLASKIFQDGWNAQVVTPSAETKSGCVRSLKLHS